MNASRVFCGVGWAIPQEHTSSYINYVKKNWLGDQASFNEYIHILGDNKRLFIGNKLADFKAEDMQNIDMKELERPIKRIDMVEHMWGVYFFDENAKPAGKPSFWIVPY